jgi:hypothetical protein
MTLTMHHFIATDWTSETSQLQLRKLICIERGNTSRAVNIIVCVVLEDITSTSWTTNSCGRTLRPSIITIMGCRCGIDSR